MDIGVVVFLHINHKLINSPLRQKQWQILHPLFLHSKNDNLYHFWDAFLLKVVVMMVAASSNTDKLVYSTDTTSKSSFGQFNPHSSWSGNCHGTKGTAGYWMGGTAFSAPFTICDKIVFKMRHSETDSWAIW